MPVVPFIILAGTVDSEPTRGLTLILGRVQAGDDGARAWLVGQLGRDGG